MNLSQISVAIVGGGIGGMAAAVALAQGGAQVELFEQAPVLSEVGAGLQISANGQAVLRSFGIARHAPPDAASVSPGTVFRDGARGRLVARVPAPQVGPTWYMHRADLLGLLMKAARGAGVKITLGRAVTPGKVQADVIIAADGVKSVWRSVVDGPDTPQFTGQVAWRAIIPWGRQGGEEAAVLSMGRKAHVVSYPLRGGSVMNLVAVEERTGWTEEGWSLAGDAEELKTRFADFGGLVGEIIQSAHHVHQWALYARPVAGTWVKDNVCLLGDAAHPTLPFMAQGACLALEDACVLAGALKRCGSVPDALARYQSLRQVRAERVVALARGNAWRFHMRKPLAWGAQAVLAVGAGALAQRLEWVYRYDPTRVFDDHA